MTVELSFPHDEKDRQNPDFDLAADYLELTAFYSDQNRASTRDLTNAAEIGSEEEYKEIDEEMNDRKKLYAVRSGGSAVGRMRLTPHNCKATGL